MFSLIEIDDVGNNHNCSNGNVYSDKHLNITAEAAAQQLYAENLEKALEKCVQALYNNTTNKKMDTVDLPS